MGAPIVALVHGTPAGIRPAAEAFTARFPQATLWNVLDDRLITEADAAGALTSGLHRRMARLIGYAIDGGADAVQLTCSMYGPVAQTTDPGWPVPVFASDQAMFARLGAERPGRIAVLGPLRSGVDDTVARLGKALDGDRGRIEGVVVDGAPAAIRDGHLPRLAELMAATARVVARDADVVVLGQYSVSPAHAAVSAAVSVPVLSPPHLAADAVRAALAGRPSA